MSCKRRRRRTASANQEGRRRTSKRQVRNWLDMPEGIMLLIFMKLGVVEILVNAQNVCSYWRKLAKEPLLFRALDFQGAEKYLPKHFQLHRLALEAVARSRGQLVTLSSTEGCHWEDILLYVIHTNSLKSLQLRFGTWMSGDDLVEVIRGLHSVEELDICFSHFSEEAINEIGRTCQKLTSFRFHALDVDASNGQVSTNVRNLPKLRHLTLGGFLLTNEDLQTILDGCPLLEHLDLQHCLCGKVQKDLLMRCATKIKYVIPPDTSRVGDDGITVFY